KSIEINNLDAQLYLRAIQLANKLGKFELSKKYFKEAFRLDPENEEIIREYLEYLNYLNEYDRLIKYLVELPEHIKEVPRVLWILAIANNELEEYQDARMYFDKA